MLMPQQFIHIAVELSAVPGKRFSGQHTVAWQSIISDKLQDRPTIRTTFLHVYNTLYSAVNLKSIRLPRPLSGRLLLDRHHQPQD